jgi:hypothetical protein
VHFFARLVEGRQETEPSRLVRRGSKPNSAHFPFPKRETAFFPPTPKNNKEEFFCRGVRRKTVLKNFLMNELHTKKQTIIRRRCPASGHPV